MRVNFEKSTIYNGGNTEVCLKTAGRRKARILFRYTQKSTLIGINTYNNVTSNEFI